MDITLYVYGNGDFIYYILMSVNAFMHHSMSFFKVAAIISLVAFAVESTGVLPTRGYDWTKFIKVFVLISLFVLTPYHKPVIVTDVITNQNYVSNIQDSKIPIGLILPMSMASTVVYRLIMLYQQNYEIDSSLNYSYSGMNFGANFIQSLDNANSYDDKFNYNLDQYMQNCGFPLLHKAGATSELRTSNDIFKTLAAYTSAARFVQQEDFTTGAPIVKACSTAITDINNYYDNNTDKFMNNNAQMMGISSGEGLTRFMTAANATATNLMGISAGASTALKQAIGMNMIMASLKDGAQGVGNGTLALAAYDAEQFQQYKKSGELSGSAAARTIPILVGVAFALLFFLYPVMIFLAIAAGSYKAIGVFFQIIVTINLIPLMYEIINYISTFYLEKKLGVVINGGSIYSYDMSTSLYSFTDNMIVAGNYLAAATPLLAYALVSGSAMALTSVFGHINDPAKSKAMQVGDDLARGNQNLGNASVDNMSFNNLQGNKMDDQLSMNTGSAIMKNTTPGGIQTNVGGQNYDQNFKSDLLSKPDFTQMASSSLQNSLSNSQEQIGQLSKQWGQQSQRLHDLSNNISSSSNHNLTSGSEEAKSIQHAQALASSIEAKMGTPGQGVLGSGVGANISSASRDSLNKDLKEYQSVANQLTHSSDQAVRDAFQNSSSLTSNSTETVQKAVATSQALNDVTSNQSSVNTNFSNDFADSLRSQGLDPTQMSASSQNAAAEQFVKEKLNTTYGIHDNLQAPTHNTEGIHKLSNRAASDNINANNIDVPAIDTTISKQGKAIYDHTNKAATKFENNPGKVVGAQVIEQAKTGYNAVNDGLDVATEKLIDGVGFSGNAVDVAKNAVKNNDVVKKVIPSTKTKQEAKAFVDSYLGNDTTKK